MTTTVSISLLVFGIYSFLILLDPKILVVGGGKTEIWPRSKNQCNLQNFPMTVSGAVVFKTSQGPVICGGQKYVPNYGNKVENRCWIHKEDIQWMPNPPMKIKREHASAIEVNNDQTLIIGGIDEKGFNLKSTELYSSSGSETGKDFPLEIRYHCSFKINATHAMVTGGHQDGSKDASSTWFVDLTTTTVTPGPALKTGRAHHGCTIFQHRTKSFGIVAGGHVSGSSRGCERPRCGYLDSTEMIDLDEESPKWTEGMQDKSKIVYL